MSGEEWGVKTYRFRARFPRLALFLQATGLISIVAFAIWSYATTGDAGQLKFWLWFPILVAGVFAWMAFFKLAYELRYQRGTLTWRSILRSGEARCEEIRSVRNVMRSWPWPLVRIRTSQGPSVYVNAKSSFRAFVDALSQDNPRIQVDLESYDSWRHRRVFDDSVD